MATFGIGYGGDPHDWLAPRAPGACDGLLPLPGERSSRIASHPLHASRVNNQLRSGERRVRAPSPSRSDLAPSVPSGCPDLRDARDYAEVGASAGACVPLDSSECVDQLNSVRLFSRCVAALPYFSWIDCI